MRQSPFNLCQVPGFGFKRIDAIVQKSGGDLRDPKRVHGALFYALEDAPYIDEQTSEQIAAQKGTPTQPGVESPYRNRPIEETLDSVSYTHLATNVAHSSTIPENMVL